MDLAVAVDGQARSSSCRPAWPRVPPLRAQGSAAPPPANLRARCERALRRPASRARRAPAPTNTACVLPGRGHGSLLLGLATLGLSSASPSALYVSALLLQLTMAGFS